MSDPLFVLDLGGGTYVDARGALMSGLPSGAVALPKPPDLRLDPGTMASALRDLTDPDLTIDNVTERWKDAGQSDEFLQFVLKSANVLSLMGGVVLQVTQPAGLVASTILGLLTNAFASSSGLDPATLAEVQRIVGLEKAKADVDQANLMLTMYSGVQGNLESVRSAFGDVVRFDPTGPARLAAFTTMKNTVQTASAAVVQIRDSKWPGVYDSDDYKTRVGLAPILCRVRPDGSLDPVKPQPSSDTRFDYRLGLPMLLYLSTAYPAMIQMAAPIYRSQGTYRDQLRLLAGAIDAFVVRLQDECFSRTQHTPQSLLNHEVFPS